MAFTDTVEAGTDPPIRQQGNLNACVPIVICDALGYWALAILGRWRNYAPLYLYYFARARTGHQNRNFPVRLSDAERAIADYGLCREADWPWAPDRWTTRPSPEAIQAAQRERLPQFETLPQCQASLVASVEAGRPFWFFLRMGALSQRRFLRGDFSDVHPLPVPSSRDVLAEPHAMLAIGFDPERDVFLVRNSFGPNWGSEGKLAVAAGHFTDARTCTSLGRIKVGSLDIA